MFYNDEHENDQNKIQNNTPYTNRVNSQDFNTSQNGYIYQQPPVPPKKDKKRHPFAFGAAVVSLAFVFSMVGSAIGNNLSLTEDGQDTNITSSQTQPNQDNSIINTKTSDGTVMTIEEVVDATADSVVEITTENITTGSRMQQLVSTGAGSGVIITDDGYIITNNHVVADSSKITVTLKNGEQYNATLIGTDEKTDIAVIKITAQNLTSATIGSSASLKVGQDTIVIGNPLGQLGGTVSNGILSSLSRDITIDGTVMNLLQTNAAINRGNSGGGMFNNKGELIGIVNAKSSGEGIEGIGFAIPIDKAISVANDLMQYGYVQGRVELGVTLLNIEDQLTAMMYNVNEAGVYVYNIDNSSNAAKAGLTPGDRIAAMNDKKISTSTDITALLDTLSVGETITMQISRGGQPFTITFILQEANRGVVV